MSEPLKNIQPQVGCPYVPCGGFSAKAKRIKSVEPFTADKLKNIHTELVTCPYVNCGSFSGTKSKRVYTAENLAAIYKNIHTREDCPFVECVCPDPEYPLSCGCTCHDWYLFAVNDDISMTLPSGWSWQFEDIHYEWIGLNSGWKKHKIWDTDTIIDVPAYDCQGFPPSGGLPGYLLLGWGHTCRYQDGEYWGEFFFYMNVRCEIWNFDPEDPEVNWVTGVYSKGTRVNHNAAVWESLVDNNNGEPGVDTRWEEDKGRRELHKTVWYSLSPGPINAPGWPWDYQGGCHMFGTGEVITWGPSPESLECYLGYIRKYGICDWDADTCARWDMLECDSPNDKIVYYPTTCKGPSGGAVLKPGTITNLVNACAFKVEQAGCEDEWAYPLLEYPIRFFDPGVLPIGLQHRPSRAGGFIGCKDLCTAYFASDKAFDLWPWAAFEINKLSIHSRDPRSDPDDANHLLGIAAAVFADDPTACRKRVLLTSVEFEGVPLKHVPWLGFWSDTHFIAAVEIEQECYFNIDGRLELYSPPDHPENALVYYTGCPDPIWGQLKPPADINAETQHIPKIHGQLNANVTAVAVTATPTYLDPDNFPCVPTCP